MHHSVKRAQRNIAIVTVIILAAVCCASFDLSFDTLSSGGSIKGSSPVSIPHSLIANTPSSVHENNGDNNGQSLGRADPASNIFIRIIRKILVSIGGLISTGSRALISHYFLAMCAASCAYLFLLTNVRFIHLKDGSK